VFYTAATDSATTAARALLLFQYTLKYRNINDTHPDVSVDVDGTPRILWPRHGHVQPVERRTRFAEALVAFPVALWRGQQAGRHDNHANAQVPQSLPAGYAQVSVTTRIYDQYSPIILTIKYKSQFENP